MGEIVITKWGPDTCGCTLNYSWDRDSSEDTRVHTFEGYDRRCQDHEHLIDHHVYNAVLEENQRKNILLQHALEAHPHKLARQISNRGGGTTRVLKDDIEYKWFFSGRAPDRILNVTFSEPLTQPEKDLIEARFPGKVKVH